jgi:nitrogen regulatory protein PII
MNVKEMKLVTIVAESVLADKLTASVKLLGATGHTITDAKGEGSRGMRTGEIPGSNVRIETLVDQTIAARILDDLAAHYFPHYAIAAWVTDVHVVRAEKYIRKEQ